MADPQLLLILLLAGGDGDAQATSQIGAAAREALGPDIRVVIEEREGSLTDEEAIASGAQVGASALTVVRWLDRDEHQARVRLYFPENGRWSEQRVSFRSTDPAAECEHAVGYLVGTVVRTTVVPAATPSTPAPSTPAPSTPAPTPTVIAGPQVDRPAPKAHGSIDISVAGAIGVGGDATGLGPSVAARAFVSSHLGVELGGLVRFGEIDDANLTTRTLRGAAGLTWRTDIRPIELLVALDMLALQHWARHQDPPATRSRWVTGTSLGVTVGYQGWSFVGPFAGLGAEIAWGKTPIAVAGASVATIPLVRATAEGGIRFRF